MIKTFAIVVALLAGVAAVTPADARGGCGYGWHRGGYGGCRHNWGPGPRFAGPVPRLRPLYRACPRGFHLGRYGERCWRN